MKWVMRHKRLWYLLDPEPVKTENGIPVSTEVKERDADAFCALLMESIHEDNIFLIEDCTTPKEMWTALQGRHRQMTSGSRFYLLRTLMSMSVADDEDISAHIIEIGSVGAKLRKLCKNGSISIEDIQTASLIASLPESFTSVTSPFEQREDVNFDELSRAVKGHVVTRKNRINQSSAAASSTANTVTNDPTDTRQGRSKQKGKKRPEKTNSESQQQGPGPCTFCKAKYHDVSSCLQKKNEDLNQKMDTILKKMSAGKSNLACESDSNSDYSESMARSATSFSRTNKSTVGRLNVHSGTSDTLVPPTSTLLNPTHSNLIVRTANNTKIKANSSGRLPLTLPRFPAIKAHMVPGLAEPLLSVSDVTDKNTAVTFLRNSVIFSNNVNQVEELIRGSTDIIAEGRREHKSYYLYDEQPVSFRTLPSVTASYLTWHHRLSHTSL